MALIEREAVESAIAKLMPSFTTPDGSGQLDEIIFYAQQMCASAIDAILELPTIDAAPVVHARWVSPDTLDCHCSVCGEQPECEQGESVPLYDYCPYCNARMDGGDTNAD